MNIRDILEALRKGSISIEDAEKALRLDYIEKVNDHTVFDHGRRMRKDIPEVVYALSKTPKMVADTAKRVPNGGHLLISRASKEHYEAVVSAVKDNDVTYHETASMISVGHPKATEKKGMIGILTAGSSDIRVAEEAKLMAGSMGCECITSYDVGVAGVHRVLEPMKAMLDADVDAIIVVAGMEGALPSLVASLASVPVIGVPVSTGYGYGGNGEAALMTMLQTCSPGLAVVNIDNGIGAGSMAAIISRRRRK
ncbi:MAG: nickel pincer cofactor biosynthesis protein LarB [Methanomassiliicoccaceae archaeon]|jgi:NCAIR mutase (PurE)-related protein|nr:nickel pincer cofactor biosynthesis protein LarB [Methanomassiliicoccaceae archaeon]